MTAILSQLTCLISMGSSWAAGCLAAVHRRGATEGVALATRGVANAGRWSGSAVPSKADRPGHGRVGPIDAVVARDDVLRCPHGTPSSDPCVKCALANGAGVPFDESLPPVQSGTHAPSSLISDLNASADPEDAFRAVQPALQAQLQEAADLLHYGPDLPRLKAKAEGRAEERARIRAIVMRLMGNEWSANQLLEEIGE